MPRHKSANAAIALALCLVCVAVVVAFTNIAAAQPLRQVGTLESTVNDEGPLPQETGEGEPSTAEQEVAASGQALLSEEAPEGWVERDGQRYWYENGSMARSKEIYDPISNAWYWLDADGSMAHDKDVWLPAGNKWVRYDGQGHMIKGEDKRYGGWYFFDYITGAMQKGFAYIENHGKWVFYDRTTGRMLYGEQGIDGNWYYLNETTGAVSYGWTYLTSAGKWVYYGRPDGTMRHGDFSSWGASYHADDATGAIDPQQVPASSTAAHSDFAGLVQSGRINSVRLIGDSISVGVAAQDNIPLSGQVIATLEGVSYHEASGDVPSFANNLRSCLARAGVSFANAGVSEKTMRDLAVAQDAWLGGERDTAIVVLGTNDRYYESLSDYEHWARCALGYLSSQLRQVYIASSPPTSDGRGNFSTEQAAEVLERVSGEFANCRYLALNEEFTVRAKFQGYELGDCLVDGVHPNAAGHALLWESLQQSLGF